MRQVFVVVEVVEWNRNEVLVYLRHRDPNRNYSHVFNLQGDNPTSRDRLWDDFYRGLLQLLQLFEMSPENGYIKIKDLDGFKRFIATKSDVTVEELRETFRLLDMVCA